MGDASVRRWDVGKVVIARIAEMTDTIPWTALFPEEHADLYRRHDWLTPHFITRNGQVLLALQAFVVVAGKRRIVVDTCVGNSKDRAIPSCNNLQTSFLEDLTAAGFPPESIDTVLCTHLHFDHVGWNTRLVNGRWVPTFPNARYLFGRTEWDHTQAELASPQAHTEHVVDSVQPIIDAGLADFVETDHRVSDEIWLEPTPGHTPGHVSVHIASEGQHAVITGDLMHNPAQMAEPDLCSHACSHPDMARRTRRDFLDRYQDRKALVVGSHFCDPTAGWVVRDGANWRFSAD
ncbi:MAG: MBL fold metallo-hydrolase [Rhodospirillales bacterium]|nr:MBL fold metallo-hydrolase [Rhodospirillales bacterium]